MRQLSGNFKKGSFVLCGAACALLLVYYILQETGLHIPGVGYMMGLCWMVFFLWAGMLIRQFYPKSPWWIRLPVLAVAVFFLVWYGRYATHTFRALSYLYLAIFGFGFLVPPKMLDNAGRESGWISLVLLLASVFCYVAVAVAGDRINWGGVFKTQHQDMERLLEWILGAAEPLMVLVALYFTVRVSFSKEGLSLGGKKWFQSAAAVAAAFNFLTSLTYIMPWSWYGGVRPLRLLAQPITVCGLVILVRAIKKKICKSKWADVSWREIWNI